MGLAYAKNTTIHFMRQAAQYTNRLYLWGIPGGFIIYVA